MAIVEDEVRNESEEENEIEVVVEENDNDQESDDSDDEDEDDVLENKVAELERRIAEDPYNYDDHIDLIQALWGLSELERWRSAFERLQQLTLLRAEHWLLRLKTEIKFAHTAEAQERLGKLFEQATLDCYSIPILSEWCTWAVSLGAAARAHLDAALRRAGADPASGMLFWEAKVEFERAQLEAISESTSDPGSTTALSAAREQVVRALEEAAARPLRRAAAAPPPLQPFREFAAANKLRDQQYIDKVEKQHEAAQEFLEQISHFEDKLLIVDNVDERCALYQEYIDKVKELARDEKYGECDTDGILKVLYDRATTECLSSDSCQPLLTAMARHAAAAGSRAGRHRALDACTRRCPRRHTYWTMKMQQAEHDGWEYDQVKEILETALTKSMESYREAESLWVSWLEFVRRAATAPNAAPVTDRLRRTFRLAWYSLAESWGEEANDCEVPLFWARLEYRRLDDPRRGKELFEEMFKYGDNKTMSKYWEALISLECGRSPPPPTHKLRDLFRRALRFVADYPPAVARLWTDFERDYGDLESARECYDACERKIKEWRESYQAMKDKMTGKQKGKQPMNKKGKSDNKRKKKTEDKPKTKENKAKRKSSEGGEGSEVKRKRDDGVEGKQKEDETAPLKRSHDEDEGQSTDSKRRRTDSSGAASASRDDCTLFVSNLDFKVSEDALRTALSKHGHVTSLRLRPGLKSYGGAICYCQYDSPESVEEALKHDRTPLDGRPMFFSRYSATKGKQEKSFKYATTEERNKLFVRGLPYGRCTKEHLAEVFDKYGKVDDIRIVTFKDGKPKGLAYIEYATEEAATAALAADGLELDGRAMRVALSAPPPRRDDPASALGQAKREPTGGMRRTQLSSFIPSVLQRAATSGASVSSGAPRPASDPPTASTSRGPQPGPSNGSNGHEKPLSNKDFRQLLLKK